jgi:hypothetical protein
LQCRNCGDLVDPERVELGYDYCMKEECQQRCMKRVTVAAVGVNKAADYYMKAEEVLPPPAARTTSSPDRQTDLEVETDADDPDAGPAPVRRPRPASPKRVKSTLDKLREKEAQLDTALDELYERFCRGGITAAEMNRQRDRLIKAFNQQVMMENIRYRSMLRSLPKGGR